MAHTPANGLSNGISALTDIVSPGYTIHDDLDASQRRRVAALATMDLPSEEEIIAAIGPAGIRWKDLCHQFESRIGGIPVLAQTGPFVTGYNRQWPRRVGTVAKINDTTQLLVLKDAVNTPTAEDHTESLPDDLAFEEEADDKILPLITTWRGSTMELNILDTMTVADLAGALAAKISIPVERLRLMILPRPGFVMHPFPDTLVTQTDLLKPFGRVTIFGSTNQEIRSAGQPSGARLRGGSAAVKSATPARHRDWKVVQEESTYTFHAIKPLPYLPHPERSQRFLERLANDPGIKASMRKHKFSVGLLTEMNPAEHTTQESRTLGLNRNRGEVIELRLRTDRYDGYRDYKVIRKTLCHELSHNVWSEHDRNFWDLTKQIEQEVERGDWKHGGSRLTQDEFYNPTDTVEDADHVDAGGWTGGEFVLGSGAADQSNEGLSRREIMAKAATARMAEQQQQHQQQNAGKKAEDKPGP